MSLSLRHTEKEELVDSTGTSVTSVTWHTSGRNVRGKDEYKKKKKFDRDILEIFAKLLFKSVLQTLSVLSLI